jgi:hypothetical protein
MNELEQALAVLMGHSDQAAVAQLIHTKAPALYQTIFNAGHSVATTQAKADKMRLDGEVATARAKVTELEGKITELGRANPDAAQYQQQIVDLKKQIEDREKQDKANARKGRLDSARDGLKDALIKLRVDPVYARAHVLEPEVIGRLVQNEGSDDVVVTQKGLNIPIIVTDGKQTPLDVLAAEIRAAVHPRYILADTDRGSETDGEGGPTGGGSKKVAFDKIRTDTAAAEQARATSTGMTELNKRRGLVGS